MFDRPLDLMMFLVGAGLLVIQDELSDIHSRLYIVLLGSVVLAVVKQSAYAKFLYRQRLLGLLKRQLKPWDLTAPEQF